MGWRGCVRVGSNSLWDESFKARGHLKCQRLVAKLIVIMNIKKKTSYTQTGLSALAESKDQDKTDLYIPLPRSNVVSSTSWLKMLFLFHNKDKSCFIKGYCFAPNEPNPQDWCQQCLPEINKADWTKRQGTFDKVLVIIGTSRYDATATRTTRNKWICVLSLFIVIISIHLLCQM